MMLGSPLVHRVQVSVEGAGTAPCSDRHVSGISSVWVANGPGTRYPEFCFGFHCYVTTWQRGFAVLTPRFAEYRCGLVR